MKTWGDGEEGYDPGDNGWSFLRCLYLKSLKEMSQTRR